jgi:hypothetical protein
MLNKMIQKSKVGTHFELFKLIIFETGPHYVTQVALNSWSSCFSLQSAKITEITTMRGPNFLNVKRIWEKKPQSLSEEKQQL